MIPGSFEYHAPRSIDEALGLLAKLGDSAKILAGGQSLIPAMRFRLASPDVLVDINQIDGLSYVEERGDHLAIGAMTREVAVEDSAIVRTSYPL
ncbi:MAG TPA: FAD binding domain-containing protein, partial [Kofleriaceae bacterium]|nr:FAD binding domain-containing protein [Kofleriaceae bacterium]